MLLPYNLSLGFTLCPTNLSLSRTRERSPMKTIYSCALILFLLMPGVAQSQGIPLTILFTNDVHGKTEPCG